MSNKIITAIIAAVVVLSGALFGAALINNDNGDDVDAAALDFKTYKIEKGKSVDVTFKYNKTAYTAYGTPAVEITLESRSGQYTISAITEDANGKCKFTITADANATVATYNENFNMNVTVSSLKDDKGVASSESITLTSVACTIEIQIFDGAIGPLTIPALDNAIVGEIYTSAAITAPAEVTIASWYAYGLPTGLTISKEGKIIGMPSEAKTYSGIVILGTTAEGKVYKGTCNITVDAALTLELEAKVGGVTVGTGEAINLFAETGVTKLDLTVTPKEGSDEKFTVKDTESKVYVYQAGEYKDVTLDKVNTITFDGVGSYFIIVDAVVYDKVGDVTSYYGHATTQFTVNVLSAASGNVPANIVITPVSA